MSETTKILNIKLSADEYIATAQKLKNEIDELAKKNRTIKKTTGKVTEEYIKNAVKLKTLRQQYNSMVKQLQAVNDVEDNYRKTLSKVNKIMSKQIVTKAQAEAQNKRLRLITKNLSLEDEKHIELLKRINEQIEKNTEFIRKNSDADQKRIMNIGNYASVWGEKLPVFAKLAKIHDDLTEKMEAFGVSLEKAEGGAFKLGVSLKAMGIGLIITAIAILLQVLSKLEPIMKKISFVTNIAGQVWKDLQEKIREFVEYVSNIHLDFSSIKQGFINFGKGIVSWIANFGKNIGKMWKDALAGNFKNIGKDMASAYLGNSAWEKVKSYYNDVSKRAEKLTKIQSRLKALENGRVLIAGRLKRAEDEINDKLNKGNLTLGEAKKLLKEKYEMEKTILETNLKIVQAKIDEFLMQKDINALTDDEKKEYLEYINEKEELDKQIHDLKKKQTDEYEGIQKRIYETHAQRLDKLLQKQIDNIQTELKLMRLKNRKLLDNSKVTTEAEVNNRLKFLKRLQTKEMELLAIQSKKEKWGKEKLEANKLEIELKYKDMVNSILDTKDENLRQKKLKEYENFVKEKRRILNETIAERNNDDNPDNDAEQNILNLRDQYNLELELLQKQLDDKLISEDDYYHKRKLLVDTWEAKISKAKLSLKQIEWQKEQQLMDARLKAAHSVVALQEALFGKSKAVSIAMAIVDTWAAAVKVLRAEPPLPAPVKIAEMVSIVAAGMASVYKIMSTDIGSSGGGASGGTSSTQAISTPAVTINTPPATQNTPTSQISSTANANTVRVINVARDTQEVANTDLQIENVSHF